jgi:prepilin-type N-terminal cleavage/methylation domain-containing protein
MKYTRQQGFTLIECLVYMALFVVVVGFATVAFFHFWDDTRGFNRNAQEVVRVLHAGDQWRADIRSARRPIQMTSSNGEEQLRIPATNGDITYSFSNGELRRQEKVLLADLKSSEMESNQGVHVPAWRWELEIKSIRKQTLWRPLFTFEAVAGPSAIP